MSSNLNLVRGVRDAGDVVTLNAVSVLISRAYSKRMSGDNDAVLADIGMAITSAGCPAQLSVSNDDETSTIRKITVKYRSSCSTDDIISSINAIASVESVEFVEVFRHGDGGGDGTAKDGVYCG